MLLLLLFQLFLLAAKLNIMLCSVEEISLCCRSVFFVIYRYRYTDTDTDIPVDVDIPIPVDTGCHMSITIQDTHFEFQIKFYLKKYIDACVINFVIPSDF
jgi:hypothetical protein